MGDLESLQVGQHCDQIVRACGDLHVADGVAGPPDVGVGVAGGVLAEGGADRERATPPVDADPRNGQGNVTCKCTNTDRFVNIVENS